MTRYEQMANTLSPSARVTLINTRSRIYSPLPAGTTDATRAELATNGLVTPEGRINDFGLGVRTEVMEQDLEF